jgi:myosin-18
LFPRGSPWKWAPQNGALRASILVPPQLAELQRAYEGAKKTAQQLKRKCHRLTWDLEDTRVLLENQQSRNHDLEKKQRK